jgi:hypothetical protein
MQIHYYMLCYRSEALVASHLDPESFGRYMAIGTRKLSRGNVMFFEIDPGLKSTYFKLDDIHQRCVPHPDGSPKRSKYISVYRVLEHLPLPVIGNLYLGTVDGRVLGIEPSEPDESSKRGGPNLYQELCPLTPLVVSAACPTDFTQLMVSPKNPISVPRMFFADLILERDETGHISGYLPYSEPMHIVECIAELERGSDKPTKTVSRNPSMLAFFRTIRRGFFLGDETGVKFYKFPERRSLEVEHARWWRSASAS